MRNSGYFLSRFSRCVSLRNNISFSCHGLQRKLDDILITRSRKKTLGKCFELTQHKLPVLLQVSSRMQYHRGDQSNRCYNYQPGNDTIKADCVHNKKAIFSIKMKIGIHLEELK